jgi:transposase
MILGFNDKQIHFRSKDLERKFKELFEDVLCGRTALTSSKLAGVHRKTSQRICERLRGRVVEMAMEEARLFTSEVEIDESYFGPRRLRGRRGRGSRLQDARHRSESWCSRRPR